jgi:radical SAM superfamily enzyme YgiQ (UPF0313 family)
MKVAFASMSGVRVINPTLRELGVSLPGFVERGNVIASLPSLAGITLAAMTPPHIQFDYYDVPEVNAAPDFSGYDLVAISSFTAMAKEAYILAAKLKAQKVRTVMGGLHATWNPDDVAPHVDAVCVGEGEALWSQILNDAQNGSLQKYYRQPEGVRWDMQQSPIPKFELLDLDRYNRLTVQTSRGCPLDCSFCAASKVYGNYRIKSVEQVMTEIDAIKKIWANPFIEFADDNTFVNKRWGKEFLTQLRSRDVRWFTETDVSLADDPSMLDLLAESGCQQVLIGLEAIDATSLQGLDQANWKMKRRDGYVRFIDEVQSRGITVNGCFILGLDDQTAEVFPRVKDFILETGLLESQVTVLTPFPGTRLFEQYKKEGRLLDEYATEKCTLFDVNFHPKKMTVDDLEQGMRYLFKELYNEEIYSRRKRHYIELYKQYMHTKTALSFHTISDEKKLPIV